MTKMYFTRQVMMTAFNTGDFLGKHIGYIQYLQRVHWIYTLAILRTCFIPIFILMAKNEGSALFQNDYFILGMIFVFSLTNGFISTSLVHLSSRKVVDPSTRDTINFLSNFAMTLGIDVGIVLAIFVVHSLPSYTN